MLFSDWSSDVCSSDLYGAAATAPQGAISCVHKFLAMGQWAHAKAIYALCVTVLERIKPSLEGVCTDKTMFVTSVADGRPTYVVASAIHDQQIGRASCRERVCQYV